MGRKKGTVASTIHPFLKILLDDGRSWMDPAAEAAKKGVHSRKREEFKLSLGGHYRYQVFGYASRLTELPEQLRVVATFIQHRPTGRAFKKLGIRRGEYVSYHYRNYVVLLQTALDVAVRLTGETLALGLKPRDMNHNTVVENVWTERWGLKPTLQNLEKVTAPFKKVRNELIHAGESPHIEQTQEINLIEAAQTMGEDPPTWLSEQELDAAFNAACNELVEQITGQAKDLTDAISAHLTELQRPYAHWARRLDAEWRSK